MPGYRPPAGATKGEITYKDPVRVATAAALPANTRTGNVLTADVNGALPAQDGVTLALNDRILVKNEADSGGSGATNGIFTLTAAGDASNPWTLTRATDMDETSEAVPNIAVLVSEGTAKADTFWQLITDAPITLNTTSLTFAQLGSGTNLTGLGVDNHIARWNGTDTIQDSNWLIDDGANGAQYPLNNDSQDLGTTTNRIRDIYMGSTINYAAASDLIFSEAGTERMRLTGANVRIPTLSEFHFGTSSQGVIRYDGTFDIFTTGAGETLSISTSLADLFIGSGQLIDITAPTIKLGRTPSGFVRIGATAAALTKLTVQSDAVNTYACQFIDSVAAPIMAIREDGLVGIGTITPNAMLNVVGDGVTTSILNIEDNVLGDIFAVQENGNVTLGWTGGLVDYNLFIRNIGNKFGTSAYIWNGNTTGTQTAINAVANGSGGTNHYALIVSAQGATNNFAIASSQGNFEFSGGAQQLSLGRAILNTSVAVFQQTTGHAAAVDRVLQLSTNKTTGTNYGLFSGSQAASTGTNIAGYFIATGATTNYGLLVAGGNVGIGTVTPDASALLEMVSTTQGLLLPRMTTVQRDAITAVEGLLLANITTNQLNYYNGTSWVIAA